MAEFQKTIKLFIGTLSMATGEIAPVILVTAGGLSAGLANCSNVSLKQWAYAVTGNLLLPVQQHSQKNKR
jgi:hypothetical protein